MRKLLIPLLAALALPTAVEASWFGKYGSFEEAKKACDEWVKKKEWVITQVYSEEAIGESGWINYDNTFRKCIHEEITREILGFEFVNLDKIYSNEEKYRSIKGEKKVKKRFEYYKNIPIVQSDLRKIYNQEQNQKNSALPFCKRTYQRAQYGQKYYYGRYLVNSEGKVYYVNCQNCFMEDCGVDFKGNVGKDTIFFSCSSAKKREKQVRWEIGKGKLVQFSRWKSCDEKYRYDVEKYTYYQKYR